MTKKVLSSAAVVLLYDFFIIFFSSSSTTTTHAFISIRQQQSSTSSSSQSRNVPSSLNLNLFGRDVTPSDSVSGSTQEEDANTLLKLLLNKRKQDLAPFSFDRILGRFTASYQEEQKDMDDLAKILIERLISPTDEPNRYDPTTCLLGPLFVTMYSYTPNQPDAPEPLWKRISLQKENIQGQQYFESKTFTEEVVNYSEIMGPNFYLEARGSFTESAAVDKKPRKTAWPLSDFFSKQKPQSEEDIRRLRTCPDSFDVTVREAAICSRRQDDDDGTTSIQKFKIPIQGSSVLTVLYADPKLRIFVSPLDNKSGTGAGSWENEGLIVVQVRSDLLDDKPEALDVR
jgi:hypothetical protein